jgi:mono/diheme cytochrome c family protein
MFHFVKDPLNSTARRTLREAVGVCVVLMGSNAANADTGKPEISFERHVRPILRLHCFTCHGEDTQKKDFDARQTRLLLKGGESGPVIVPGKSAESLLVHRVTKGEMPPEERKKLTPEEIALISAWIDAGAPTDEPEEELDPQAETFVTSEDQKFWAYQKPVRPHIPTWSSGDRVRTPIDALLMAKLQEKKLGFSSDAEKVSLIRRAYIDLIGLPPTPKQVDDYLADESPQAYEKVIDELLASPHYGERWGRHWLDTAGYADSEGYSDRDELRPWAYRYRDYVIKAFNDDMPYDQFLQEQLAGDEMIGWPGVPLTPEHQEKLVATGFLRNGADGTSDGSVDRVLASHQVIADTIKITMTSVLGLSVHCAQCHNHRYDPLSQKDYFRVRAVFEPAYNTEKWRAPGSRRISLMTPEEREKVKQIDEEAAKVSAEKNALTQKYIDEIYAEQIVKVPEAERDTYTEAFKAPGNERTDAQKKLLNKFPAANVTAGVIYQYRENYQKEIAEFDKKIGEIQKDRPVEQFLRPLTEVPGEVPKSVLFKRGDYRTPSHEISPGVLSVLTNLESPHVIQANLEQMKTTGRRTQLAEWLTSKENPLTARVFVNRVWMHHFGKGIVGTPGDFGSMGEKPTHPELLDWLACEFMDTGWQIKRLHKLMMTSTAYRQASRVRDAGLAGDPDNVLLWRMRIRRLEGEVVRDSILAASGKLNPKMGGPAVPVREDEHGKIIIGQENKQGANQPGPKVDMAEEADRRSVYVQVRRSQPLSMLKVFDAPVMETNCSQRDNSVSAMQALSLMNSEFSVGQAQLLAERLRREVKDGIDAQIQLAYRLVLCRVPTEEELTEAKTYVTVQTEYLAAKDTAAQAEATIKNAQATLAEAQKAIEASEAKLAGENPTEDEAKGKKPASVAGPTGPPAATRALANLCHVLLNASEFIYVD